MTQQLKPSGLRPGPKPSNSRISFKAAPSLPLDEFGQQQFRRELLAWFRRHARVLPWRGIDDPYRTWLSEIMLQQTRVDAVIDHFRRFLARFPTLLSLALAPEEDVLALWSGLGYYRRARMLHRAAKFLVEEHGGTLPRTAAELRALPGIGAYTSAAIASIAFGEPVAVVDGNVQRVLLRIAGKPEERGAAAEAFVSTFAQALLDRKEPGDSNQAIMELGATVCLPRSPLCLQCPVFDLCRTRGEHPTLPRAAMRSARVLYALTLRGASATQQVLLHRRAADLSLMPGMLELPPLETAPETPPRLRVRHAIVGTNYYVEIFMLDTEAEVCTRMQPAASPAPNTLPADTAQPENLPQPPETVEQPNIIRQAVAADLQWAALSTLHALPLTGLARKVLQRTGFLSTT